jgi:hypothetical protein
VAGIDPAIPQPPVLRWSSAHDHAISPAHQQNVPLAERPYNWHSGHVEALYPVGRSVLVGAHNSGVWVVNPAFDAIPEAESFPATPVSWAWDNPLVRCFTAVPETDPSIVLAGCDQFRGEAVLVAMQLSTVLGGIEIGTTRVVPTPSQVDAIWSLAFVDETTLVAATNNGVWWTVVQDDPLQTWLPTWQQAQGLPRWHLAGVNSVAPGADRSVTAGANGIWHGTWSTPPVNLNFVERVNHPGVTSVASCATNRKIAYAVAANPADGHIADVWRSNDGGDSWQPFAVPAGAGNQGNNWNNCIAVHPDDPETVAIGWRTGPFVWDTSTASWQRRTDEPGGHMHSDLHALVFARTDAGEEQLWAGTDGGVCLSLDGGQTWDSRYNRHLLTIEVYSTQFLTLQEYGYGIDNTYERDTCCFHVHPRVPDLFGAATQDNGTMFSTADPAGHRSMRACDGGDGQAILFCGDDLVLHTNKDADTLRVSHLLPTGVLDDDFGSVIPADGDPNGLPKLALAATHQPTHQLGGQHVLAVAGGATKLLVLLESTVPGGSPQLQTVATIPQIISAVASFDGSSALVGTVDGHLYSVEVDTGTVTALPLPLPSGLLLGASPSTAVRRLRWRGPNHRLAILGNGRIARESAGGWHELTGLSWEAFDVDGDPNIADGALFAATVKGVFSSIDLGATWSECSEGLPHWPQGRAIQVVNTEGGAAVYLATYGWGVFRASLQRNDVVHLPPIDSEQARILFGIIGDGDGVEIVGGSLRPVPPREPARQLAVALAVQVLAAQLHGAAAETLTASAGALVRQLAARQMEA